MQTRATIFLTWLGFFACTITALIGCTPVSVLYVGDTFRPINRNLLIIAAQSGDVAYGKELISSGRFKVDERPGGGSTFTSLMVAAERGHLEFVQYLLSVGADPNARAFRDTPFSLAASNCHVEVISALQSAGAKANFATSLEHGSVLANVIAGYNFTSCRANRKRRNDLARMLLDAGADPNFRINDRMALLTGSARAGEYELVELLLSHGADVHGGEKAGGYTPLKAARGIFNSYPDLSKEIENKLLAHGAAY